MKSINEIADAAIGKFEAAFDVQLSPAQINDARRIASFAARIAIDEMRQVPTVDPLSARPDKGQEGWEPKYSRQVAVGGVAVSDESDFHIKVRVGYTGLRDVLVEALNQAQYGKGAERHNLTGKVPFERQRMQLISELIGSVDGMTYQACKKITEGVKLPTLERQVAELLGAIVYIAGMIVFLRKRDAEEKTNGFYRAPLGKSWADKDAGDPVERMFGSFEDQLAAQEAKYPAIREHNERVRAVRRNPLAWRNHTTGKMPSTISPTTLVEVSYGDDRRSRGPVEAKAENVDWSSVIEWRFSPKIVPTAAGDKKPDDGCDDCGCGICV